MGPWLFRFVGRANLPEGKGMITPVFGALSTQRVADCIVRAQRRVCYAAPGIHDQAAVALASLRSATPAVAIMVSLDFNEHTLRMGYGTLSAVELLRSAGVGVTHSPGFRSAVLIVDDDGWVFTPTALYLEAEPQSDETPNAIRLTPQQVNEILVRLSPAARREAVAAAPTPAAAAQLEAIPLEVSELPLGAEHFAEVKQSIEIAPPVKFDVVRQVRVFEPYLQYVELALTGAAVQRHRVRIPKALQNLGVSQDLEGKLKTTFDLIEKGSSLSSKALDDELNEIRKNFTPSLGKDHGRVVLKSAKIRLLERLAELRKKLEAHQQRVETELSGKIEESMKQVVEHYLPLARANPPDALVGSLFQVADADIRAWIEDELSAAFPKASDLIRRMVLDDRYKDVTFETLNRPDFLDAVKDVFPRINWEKAYNEFKAAGETRPQ